LLEGEAGVGKSRLIEEFLAHATSRGVECLIGSGDSIEQATPYYAWRSVFTQFLGLDMYDLGDREGRRAQVMHQIAGDAVLERLAPLLRDIVGVDIPDNDLTAAMTGEVRAYNTQDLLVHLLRRDIAANDILARPIAVVLEDAHWFDSASWALLRQVHEGVAPLLLLVAARPMNEPGPLEYASLRASERTDRILLAALTLAETRDIVTQRLGHPTTESISRLIYERAEGNPFFTEELALALGESGVIRLENGIMDLIPAAAGTEWSLPDTVQSTILARIDRLDPCQQLMVKVASVIGRTFAYDLLQQVYPVETDRPQLLQKLTELERLDLTLKETLESELTYLYKHETTREVAYSLLLFAQRRQLHKAVAESLELSSPPDFSALYPRLAWHWGRADEVEKTLFYLEKAGEQALLEGAYKEAAEYFREALLRQALPDENNPDLTNRHRRAHWERLLGEALLGLGSLPESRAALERAVALLGFPVPASSLRLALSLERAVSSQLVNRIFRYRFMRWSSLDRATLREAVLAYLRLIETYFYLAGPAETFNAVLQALNIAEAAGPSPELARAYALTGWIISMVPQFTLSDLYLRLANELVSKPEGRAALQPVRFFTGFSRLAAGRWPEGHAALEEAVQLAERLGDKRRWIEAVCGWSTLIHYKGEFARRVKMGADVLYTSARRQGDLQAEAWGLLDQIESLIALGDLKRTMTLLQALTPFLEKDIGRSEQIWGYGLLAVGLLRSGQLAAAYDAARRANLVSVRQAPVAVYTFEGYAGAAEVLLALWENGANLTPISGSEVAQSARQACHALKVYARVFPIARPRSWLCQGQLRWLSGHPTQGMNTWQRGLKMALQLQMPYEEGRSLYEIGRHHAEPTPRRDYLERAALIFERLGAADDLGRTRQILAFDQASSNNRS
jgi:hypothetical protein